MSASQGEIQTWYPMGSTMRIINVKFLKIHLQTTDISYIKQGSHYFQIEGEVTYLSESSQGEVGRLPGEVNCD